MTVLFNSFPFFDRQDTTIHHDVNWTDCRGHNFRTLEKRRKCALSFAATSNEQRVNCKVAAISKAFADWAPNYQQKSDIPIPTFLTVSIKNGTTTKSAIGLNQSRSLRFVENKGNDSTKRLNCAAFLFSWPMNYLHKAAAHVPAKINFPLDIQEKKNQTTKPQTEVLTALPVFLVFFVSLTDQRDAFHAVNIYPCRDNS